jgi:hypothetical protein
LPTIGIRPSGDLIGPPGLHLRWSFPSDLGFPEKGFRVFRRESESSKPDSFSFNAVERDEVVPSGWSSHGFSLFFSPRVSLTGSGSASLLVSLGGPPPRSESLSIEFDEPVIVVEVFTEEAMHDAGLPLLRGYDADGNVVAESANSEPVPGGSGARLRVSGPAIVRVELRITFMRLAAVCFETQAQARAQSWGHPLARLVMLAPPATPQAVEQIIKQRLGNGIRNRYVRDFDQAQALYGPRLDALLGALQPPSASPAPSTLAPQPPGLPQSGQAMGLRSLDATALLLLLSLDPNVARLLSLYWVDQFGASRGPVEHQAYDYKVVGI